MLAEALDGPARRARRRVLRDAAMAGCGIAALGFATHAAHLGLCRVTIPEFASLAIAGAYAVLGLAFWLFGKRGSTITDSDVETDDARTARRSASQDAETAGHLATAFLAGYRIVAGDRNGRGRGADPSG